MLKNKKRINTKNMRTMIKHMIFSIGLCFISFQSYGQEVLLLQDAINTALEKNHNIKIAKSNQEIQANNATRGNANMLPKVSLSSSYNYSNTDTELELLTNLDDPAQKITVDGAETETLNNAVKLDYTIFNGFLNQNTFKKYKLNASLGEIQARQNIETSIMQVINAYYDLANKENSYLAAIQSHKISKERYQRAKSKFDFGGSSSIDMLNAEVDLNTDEVNMKNAEIARDNSRRNLSQLLGMRPNTIFQVDLQCRLDNQLLLNNILDKASQKNASLLSADYQHKVAQKDEKISKAGMYPQVNLNSSYSFNRQENGAGQLIFNQNTGYQAGLSLQYNLFDGKKNHIRIQNAKISSLIAEEQLMQTKEKMEIDVMNAFADYQNGLEIIQLDQKSLQTAELNFQRSQELYELGQMTVTQFREAQLNLFNTQIRASTNLYKAKVSEMNLYQLTGELIGQ